MYPTMNLSDQVQTTITRYSMLKSGDAVLIGLSGGPDSVCLCRILKGLSDAMDLTLSAVYIDHGLRPDENDTERQFCEHFCADLGIKFLYRKIDLSTPDVGGSSNLQESARELRYQIYEEIAGETGADEIALGHNADDQAETVLMRLIRGSGMKGLTGIPPVRGRIIRPLAELEKADILEYLSSEGQKYMTDSSNLKEKYDRNWIRSGVLTEMKKRNPSTVKDICRTAGILRDEDAYLEIKVTKTLMRMISRKTDNSIDLFLRPLETTEKPILRRLLRRAIDATDGLRGISFEHVEGIISLIKSGNAGDRMHLPRGIRVVREYAVLKLAKETLTEIVECMLNVPGEITIEGTDIKISAEIMEYGSESVNNRDTVMLDAGTMSFPLTIRARQDGDFFHPLGFGRKKKLQDYFVDEKVPRDERDKVPVVVSGQDVVWIAGYRADERFKITDKTRRFLKLRLSKVRTS